MVVAEQERRRPLKRRANVSASAALTPKPGRQVGRPLEIEQGLGEGLQLGQGQGLDLGLLGCWGEGAKAALQLAQGQSCRLCLAAFSHSGIPPF
jgi:hypothetical protein